MPELNWISTKKRFDQMDSVVQGCQNSLINWGRQPRWITCSISSMSGQDIPQDCSRRVMDLPMSQNLVYTSVSFSRASQLSAPQFRKCRHRPRHSRKHSAILAHILEPTAGDQNVWPQLPCYMKGGLISTVFPASAHKPDNSPFQLALKRKSQFKILFEKGN